MVNTLLVNSFSIIMDTDFTAKMEEGLDEVEQGKKSWVHLVGEFYERFEKDLKRAEEQMRNIKENGLVITSIKCEKCGRDMVVKVGKFGEFLACSGYPECKNTQPLDQKIGMKCPVPDCGGEVVEKLTRKGKSFFTCSRYPECKFLSWEEPVPEVCPECQNNYMVKAKAALKCPECGKILKSEIVEKMDLNGCRVKIIKLRRSLNGDSF